MSRAFFLSLHLMAGLLDSFGQSLLKVEVLLNRADAGGVVRVALCNGKEAFDTEKGCTVQHVEATGGEVMVAFSGLTDGQYALKLFHDVNGNGQIDTNWMGIPKEPYGFSNDAMGTFGPPSWEQARFPVMGGGTVRVKLKG